MYYLLYCHRKLGPPPKPRLCYNDNLSERSIRWEPNGFTAEFKASVVLEALSGESSQAELCRRHNLSEDQVSKWKQQFLENADSVFAATDKQSSEAAERIILNTSLGG